MRLKSSFVVDGARLTQMRVEAGMSLEDMGKRIKCNKGNLSRWERGVIKPSDPAIIRLAMIFNRGDFISEVGGGKNGKRTRTRRKTKRPSKAAA